MSDGRATYLLLADFERLEEWCADVRRLFGRPPYLVGSSLARPDFRDVDVRMILPDAVFDRLFRARTHAVRIANHAISTWGQRETGLPIDFQIQRRTQANAKFSGRRSAMGIRDWSTIPTSGVPEPEAPA